MIAFKYNLSIYEKLNAWNVENLDFDFPFKKQ